MAEEPLATVVVAVDDDERIYRLLSALTAQTIPSGSLEIIVVQNGKPRFEDVDGLGGMVRYLHSDTANTAAARNMGLRAARGRYLLSIDSDCVPQPDWARTLTEALIRGPHQIVGGRIVKYAPTTWVQRHAITVVDGQPGPCFLPALHLPYVVGANAGYITEAVREAGGFDERLRSGADVDVCYRLGLRGAGLAIVPEAVVAHEDRRTLRGHFRRFRVYAVYQVLLFRLYRPVSHRRWVLNGYPPRRLAQSLRQVPAAVLAAASGNPGPAARVLLQLVEAVAIWVGDIQGSLRWRQLYL